MSDINGLEMVDELSVLCTLVEADDKPLDVLKRLIEMDFAPNTMVALRILLTLPITVASGEKSFSKLKRIKSYVSRNTK